MQDQPIPQIGFGTYGRTGSEGARAILYALEVGYRHLDTAQSYDTERPVGDAIRQSGLRREEVFVTTKIDMPNYEKGKLVPSLRRSLDQLGMDKVDLTLLHWPSPNDRVPLPVYVEQLAEAHRLGLTRLVGVSNFTIAQLRETMKILGSLPIATNQIELNPYLQNKKLADFCVANGIAVTCYLPIARGALAGDPVLTEIAGRHGASVEQVAIAFELAKGYIAIPTSGKRERIRSNFEATRLRLSASDVAAIETIDKGRRRVDPAWGPDWD